MSRVRIGLLGPTVVEVDGQAVKLTPTTIAVLARLVIANGDLVTVDEIFRDVWPTQARTVRREDRISVQKRILELRRVLEPDRDGAESLLIPTDRGAATSAYRLTVGRDHVDVHRFGDLLARAQRTDAATAVELLTEAVALWRGRPLFHVEEYAFARATIARLRPMHAAACRALVEAYQQLGLFDEALRVGEVLHSEHPDDPGLAAMLVELRGRSRTRAGTLRRDLAALGTAVVVAGGDLFAQEGAHLAVGFSDTFDTDITQDVVISRTSLQGQVLDRLYGGDRTRLDRDLRNALRTVDPVTVESRADKRRGKLARYPVGTVAVLRGSSRQVFAVAYSVMGNDLVARSSLDRLRHSLDNLWDAVDLHGRREPVAVPVMGAGLARVDRIEPATLITMIVESFVRRSRHRPVSRELRVVVRPEDLQRTAMLDVASFLKGLP
ncbi:macro domain-containing protein [Polymorphospora sp. NPDC051019]|uniref:macro domain-containing protein n=1 Tax=Polymorphospora sp. NPDC051019 TaxID=3155725 RepID=UPI0034134CCB